MNYREAMAYLGECQLGAILVAEDKSIADYNARADELLGGKGGLKNQPLDLMVRFIPMQEGGTVYANVGFGRYIKQCPAPEPGDLPSGSRLIVFREATRDILCEMLLEVVDKIKESVILCDAHSRILLLNEAACAMDDLTMEKVSGMPLGSVYNMQNDSFLAIPKVIENQQPFTDLRQNYQTLHGKRVDIVTNTYAVALGGRVLGGFAVMQDWSQVEGLNKRIIDLQNLLLEKAPAAALELLLAYDGPGDVGELHHAIEHACTPDDSRQDKSLPRILDRLEHRMLRQALEENSGNVSKTARSLGMTRQNLQYRLKKSGQRSASPNAAQ